MPIRCTLCRRPFEDRGTKNVCECGWTMDQRCEEKHHSWCPSHGADRWVGAVEF